MLLAQGLQSGNKNSQKTLWYFFHIYNFLGFSNQFFWHRNSNIEGRQQQGAHGQGKTGKTGKMAKNNSLQGKVREFENFI